MALTYNNRLEIPSAKESVLAERVALIIRSDRDCSRVFGESIRVWDGGKGDHLPWAPNLCPGLRITPGVESEEFYSCADFERLVSFTCEVAVNSGFVADVFDLIQMVRRAFYPTVLAERETVRDLLLADGVAETGEPRINFGGITITPPDGPGAALMVATFRIDINVIDILNP